MGLSAWLLLALCAADPLSPGDHTRHLTVDGRERSYLVHVPPGYDHERAAPVVLVLHGAGTNANLTVRLTGMHAKADEANFIAVYPNGTGVGVFLTWNSGGRRGRWPENGVDDVKYLGAVLDDLETVCRVDPRRVYACGLSNGGMMCYRLAAEMSDRIAAIAPVAGTMTIDDPRPKRPVPVIHFHGSDDKIVPPSGRTERAAALPFKSVAETIRIWREVNGCPEKPEETEFPDKQGDGLTARRQTYGPGQNGAEVVLVEIEGGGHTWPGQKTPLGWIGKSTLNISANDLMWEFFQKHPLP
jgi:polyhydroxybutyrate depolymerase